jgi:hypothetical protein
VGVSRRMWLSGTKPPLEGADARSDCGPHELRPVCRQIQQLGQIIKISIRVIKEYSPGYHPVAIACGSAAVIGLIANSSTAIPSTLRTR